MEIICNLLYIDINRIKHSVADRQKDEVLNEILGVKRLITHC